jgi:hypothetical protein
LGPQRGDAANRGGHRLIRRAGAAVRPIARVACVGGGRGLKPRDHEHVRVGLYLAVGDGERRGLLFTLFT